MRNVNPLIVILSLYEVISLYRNYIKVRGNGGQKLESFGHDSELKIVVLFIFVFATIFNVWSVYRYSYLFNSIAFEIYVLLALINIFRKIVVYENGLFYNGRFIMWNEMKSIKEHNSGIQIGIKNHWFKVVVLSKVRKKAELLQLISKKNTDEYNLTQL